MKCAVVTPVGPGHEYLAEDCIESVKEAFTTGRGPFSNYAIIRIDDTSGSLGRSEARNRGVTQARKEGADWIFFLDADDLMHPDAFGAMTAYHADYDAIWGLICELAEDEENYRVRDGQPVSIEQLEYLLVYDPWLTLQMGHFVRTAAAIETPFDIERDCGEDFDYYLRLWSRFRCRKVPVPLFINRRDNQSTGPRSATRGQWRQAVQRIIAERCAATELVWEFTTDGELFKFRIVNPFDLIQRHYLQGEFFELAELRFLRGCLPRGLSIVDIGANIGNHVVFLSRFLAPRRILVLEANSDLIEPLCQNLRINRVTEADTSRLGVAIGAGQSGYELRIEDPDNIGAGRLVKSATGNVSTEPLDAIVNSRVDFIKIDVEGMELDVLEGAAITIARFRPHLLVEVFNAHLDRMEGWCQDHGYRVTQRFNYIHSVNFFLEPLAGRSAAA